jgi:hypothetical protein
MSSIPGLPKKAVLDKTYQGLNKGQPITVEIYSAQCSYGAQSNYQPILTKFWVEKQGQAARVRRFTGKSLAKLDEFCQKLVNEKAFVLLSPPDEATSSGYPLSFGDITPGGDFTRLPVPEGEAIHTGGLYLSPDGKEVWKPLDIKPYQNCDFRYPSQEAQLLEHMADQPGFPKNWRIEQVNGRRFLVRPRCRVIGQDLPYSFLSLENILEIEQWIRSLNSQYWEVNDYITVAFDKNIGQLFLLDLSAAQVMGKPGSSTAWQADDTDRFYQFATQCGYTGLVKLRQDARHLTSSIAWLQLQGDEYSPVTEEHRHIYASRNRPLGGWAKIPDAVFLDGNFQDTKVWSWAVTPTELPPDLLQRYELTWAYSPIPYRK